MRFDEKNAALYGSKGGKNRWANKDPADVRNHAIAIKVTDDEYAMIKIAAAKEGKSIAGLIVEAVQSYIMQKKKQKKGDKG